MTDDPRGYAAALTERLAGACGGMLVAAYLHGSAALGGWVAQHSDVDMLFVVADEMTPDVVTTAGEILLAAGADCPGSGLECSLVTAEAARRPAAPWPFVVHVASGAGQRSASGAEGNSASGAGQQSATGAEGQGTSAPRERTLHLGKESAGDPDLIMHYAVCRAAGITLLGPPPLDSIGPVDRAIVLGYLADELGWGLANAPECYAVLNACRALAFLGDGRIVSKVAGGVAAVESGAAPGELVRRALDQQEGRSTRRRPGPEAAKFVQGVADALRAAARPAQA